MVKKGLSQMQAYLIIAAVSLIFIVAIAGFFTLPSGFINSKSSSSSLSSVSFLFVGSGSVQWTDSNGTSGTVDSVQKIGLPNTATAMFVANDTLNILATPASGYSFSHFAGSGGASGSTANNPLKTNVGVGFTVTVYFTSNTPVSTQTPSFPPQNPTTPPYSTPNPTFAPGTANSVLIGLPYATVTITDVTSGTSVSGTVSAHLTFNVGDTLTFQTSTPSGETFSHFNIMYGSVNINSASNPYTVSNVPSYITVIAFGP